MAKPIKLTEELIAKMADEFKEKLRTTRMSSGKIDYTRNLTYPKDAAVASVLFDPKAYTKMLGLVDHFQGEVGWHGTVSRADGNTFIIHDILVYPQTVTGVTVNTDQEEYTKWMLKLDDETFNAMHMHGHSHVNMSTGPSGVDQTHRELILSQVSDDSFYIFLIWNKRCECDVTIFDLQNNVLYEDDDVYVGINGDDLDMDAFIQQAESMVVNKPTTVSTYAGGTGSNYGGTGVSYYGSAASTTKKGKKSKKTDKDSKIGMGMDEEVDDYDEYVFGRGRRYY